MQVFYLTESPLSPKAQDLVQFDVDSIRQAAAGGHHAQPTIYLADPEQYEKNGRILRDSTSPRLLGYSPDDRILYANDGCNSCTHVLPGDLKALSQEERHTFAAANKIDVTLVDKIAELGHPGGVEGD
jgi:hypothetical protein